MTSSNQVVGTQFTYASPSDIASGEKAPFVLILTSASIPILSNRSLQTYKQVTNKGLIDS